MSTVSDIESKLNSVVSRSDSFADLADKVIDEVAPFAKDIPGVGAEVAPVQTAVDDFTKVLDRLKSLLAAS